MKRNIWIILLCAAILCMSVTYVSYAGPGDADDPVVTKSYLDQALAGVSTKQQTFQVVSVENGQTLLCGAGTELILRMGKASVIATTQGGLADVTDGVDIANLGSAPANHLLIVPVSDGRGLSAQTDCLVMVKGEFSVQ